MLKSKIKLILHKLFGFEKFLYYFSLFKIFTLRFDKNENDIFLFIDKLNATNKNGLVLDIGANIGITTGLIARKTSFDLHSFEPMPINYKVLEKTVARLKLNDRVTIHKIALGNENGMCQMVLPVVSEVRMHGLSHVVDPAITEFNDGPVTEDIPIKKLDDLFQNISIVGIKLDVENFEFNVLQGANSILRREKPIIYTELWDNENRMNCFRYLRELGYKSYFNNHGKLEYFENNNVGCQNFIFI